VSKVLVLYYSAYGHIEQMAQAIAEGARSAGAQVDIKRVPDGIYHDSSVGYSGQVFVDVSVAAGRISDVKVTKHTEKQWYSSDDEILFFRDDDVKRSIACGGVLKFGKGRRDAGCDLRLRARHL
jgi:uncharacterized protein with FMN-binding domain